MKRILLLMTLAMVALLCPLPAHSQAAVESWVQRYNGPGNGADYATDLAIDTNGNLFVTGYSAGSGTDYDYATIKYSGAGVPLWTNHYNGPGNSSDQAYAVAMDGSGNVFVAGASARTNGLPLNYDYSTIKYSGGGVPLWTNRYNGPHNHDDLCVAMALDTNGNVFVTGRSISKIGNDIDYDYATIKYSGAGVPLWTNRFNGPDNGADSASDIALDTSGNVFVTGRSAGIGSFWPDYVTIKYSNAGLPMWTNRYNGPHSIDEAKAVAVDINGNVFVTGESLGSGSSSDFATIKYSGAGVPLWTNRYDGGSSDTANAIALDSSGNVLITGDSSGSGSLLDYATIKYSNGGVPLWTNRFNGSANHRDEAAAVALDNNDNVFVSGYSVSNNGVEDYATVAYSGLGVPQWTKRYNGPASWVDSVTDIAVDGSGNVFITGFSTGSAGDYDYATIKYSTIPPSLTIAFTPPNTVAISWPSPSTGFTLQQNTNDIATTNWSNVLTTPTDNGTTKTVIVNPPSGTRFYRLSSP